DKKRRADRKSYLKRTYGLSIEAYDEMLAAQDHGCAICGERPQMISLHVDHDHASRALRGLLCFRCNNALGDLRDDPDLLLRAAEYLQRDDELTVLARERVKALSL